MIVHMMAGIIAAAISFVPHILLKDHVSNVKDFFISSAVGGVVYVYTFIKIKKLRGDI